MPDQQPRLDKKTYVAVVIVSVLLGLLAWRSYHSRRMGKGPLFSVVLLLRDAREVNAGGLADAAGRALGLHVDAFDPDHPDGPPLDMDAIRRPFVLGKSPAFLFQLEGLRFAIWNVDEPYPHVAKATGQEEHDPRLREALTLHKARLAVNLVEPKPAEADMARAVRILASLVAELAADDCLAVYCPTTQHIGIYEPEMKQTLRDHDLRKGFPAPDRVTTEPNNADATVGEP